MKIIPSFDSTIYYLGSLCKRQHDWNNTGQSLRYKNDGTCRDCSRIAGNKKTALGAAKRKYAERIAFISQIKLDKGCADCGYNSHPAALQFDHLPGQEKHGTIAFMTGTATMQNLLDEIAKCEVVCANCHAIRTANRHKPWVEKNEKARSEFNAPQNNTEKVTEEQVIEIRRLHADGKMSRSAIGELFGISRSNVGNIVRRDTWSHIP